MILPGTQVSTAMCLPIMMAGITGILWHLIRKLILFIFLQEKTWRPMDTILNGNTTKRDLARVMDGTPEWVKIFQNKREQTPVHSNAVQQEGLLPGIL